MKSRMVSRCSQFQIVSVNGGGSWTLQKRRFIHIVACRGGMGRTRIITDQQILEAARAVFLAEGFGASTVEIARRAGVSEGSIFKRFATKEKLFFAAMGGVEAPLWVRQLNTLAGQGNLQDNLVTLSLQIVEFTRTIIPRMVMMQSKGGMSVPAIEEPPFLRDCKALAAFFQEEIRLGRMQPCDPDIAAQTLLGAIANYVFIEQLHPSATADATAYVQALIDFLWQGIKPLD